MGQRNGWMVVACLLAAAYVVRPCSYAADDEPVPPPADPAAERAALQDVKSGEQQSALKSGEELYKRGEYALAAERLQTAVSNGFAAGAGAQLLATRNTGDTNYLP